MVVDRKIKDKAVGYIRISTSRQATEGVALKRQEEAIRKFCARRGIDLLSVYDDVASAAKPGSLARRPSLTDAIREARNAGAMLIVTEPTRLFRNLRDGDDFLKTLNVPVYSLKDRRVLGSVALRRAFEAGECFAEVTRKGSSDAAKEAFAAGRASFPAISGKSQTKSLRTRILRAGETVDSVAHVLRSMPGRPTHRELADELNRRGITTSTGRIWDKRRVREARRAAEERIKETDSIMDETDPIVPARPYPAFSHYYRILADLQRRKRSKAEHEARQSARFEAEKMEELEALKALPNFGMF